MNDFVTRAGRVVKENFTPILLCGMFAFVLAFVTFMGHVHNDSLASKGTEYAGQVLGALFLALRGVKSPPNDGQG